MGGTGQWAMNAVFLEPVALPPSLIKLVKGFTPSWDAG